MSSSSLVLAGKQRLQSQSQGHVTVISSHRSLRLKTSDLRLKGTAKTRCLVRP